MNFEVTKRIYLTDTYLFNSTAKIIALTKNNTSTSSREENESPQQTAIAVILNATIFHPQGGGQPADTGLISSLDNKVVFIVKDVRALQPDVIFHLGEFEKGAELSFKDGQDVNLCIDSNKRLLHARLHSAGHLVDSAMNLVGYGHFKPSKGYHFPQAPYVEYEGIINIEDRQTAQTNLNKALKELIASQIEITVHQITFSETVKLLGSAPEHLNPNQMVRIVSIKGSKPCPCGGTHVKNVSELGQVEVTKIKVKKGNTQINYNII